jgi:hypothetical protein
MYTLFTCTSLFIGYGEFKSVLRASKQLEFPPEFLDLKTLEASDTIPARMDETQKTLQRKPDLHPAGHRPVRLTFRPNATGSTVTVQLRWENPNTHQVSKIAATATSTPGIWPRASSRLIPISN